MFFSFACCLSQNMTLFLPLTHPPLCFCRLFGAVLIFVDIIITIVSLFIDQRDHLQSPLGLTSLVIALYFLMDVLLRVYVEG